MDWQQKIDAIDDALDNERLVVFYINRRVEYISRESMLGVRAHYVRQLARQRGQKPYSLVDFR